MSNNAYQNVKRLAPILKLLGEASRLRILYSLGLECRPVTDVVRATGMSQANVSFHLRALREAGLVRPERRGPFVYYCLPDPKLLDILHELAGWFDEKEQGVSDSALSSGLPHHIRDHSNSEFNEFYEFARLTTASIDNRCTSNISIV